jgi:endonuclease/exonuclease/phosphatase family metal-dependent hydrolase
MAVLFALCAAAVAQQQARTDDKGLTIKVMTYNLKFADPAYKPVWAVRRDWQVDLINKYRPDIIGTQEGLKEQIDFLMDHLPDYMVVGEGRKGGDDDEHMAVFIRRDRFRLREMGTFQLSETPEVLGSGPAVNPRIVTWARIAFINRPAEGSTHSYPEDYRGHWNNTREFYLFNTHLFTGGSGYHLAKLNSAKLIMERINALNRFGEWTPDRPVFLVGDFNAKADSDVYKTFTGDGQPDNPFLLKDSTKENRGIDWILYKGDVDVLSYEKIEYNVDGVYPSDHKPILVEFKFAGK